jgi:hypothetical protein
VTYNRNADKKNLFCSFSNCFSLKIIRTKAYFSILCQYESMRFDDKDITAKIQEQLYSYLPFSEAGGI